MKALSPTRLLPHHFKRRMISTHAAPLAAAACAMFQAAACLAGTLPSGGHFVAGSGSMTGNANALTINQTSSRGVIDWNSFSIGNGNRVTFENGNGATLNRVTGGNTSFILGKLCATGSVYLINPQGIVVGANGVVSTGGRFVASTLDVDNAAFMKGGALTFSGASTRRVVNLGKIGSTNGDVFLISADEIDNFGSVKAPNGSAELAVGKTVLLQDSSTGQQVFVQTGSAGTIDNAGPITAAQVNLQAADGNIFALAGDHTTIRATGTATRDGHVWLVAGSGTVTLGGTIEAHDAGGSGGTVDSDGARLQLGSVGITPLIKAGQWNLATPQFTIGDTAAASLSRSLNAGTSIALATTGGAASTGDIDVASNLGWKGNASLALNAYRTVTIDKGVKIANNGSGNLTLRADASAIDNGGSVLNRGTVDWAKSTGIVSLLYDMSGGYEAGTLLSNAAWTSPLFSGLPTQVTAYQLINSIADFALLQTATANYAGNYALGADLKSDYHGMPFSTLVGIGNVLTAGTHTFTGQFDGMGHTLDTAWVDGGFFDQIGATGYVRNFKITNSYAEPYFGGYVRGDSEALLARDNQGVIANVYVQGGVGGYADSGGGLVGTNEGTIMRAGSNAGVGSYGRNGGLVGINNGTIVQSYATAAIVGDGSASISAVDGGGLVGVNNGTISQSYSASSLVGSPYTTVAAGLAGYNNGTITQSFATGPVSGSSPIAHQSAQLAGITNGNSVGSSGGSVGTDVYWDVDTTGQTNGGPGISSANGLTTAQMSNPASFVGWNFGPGGVWAMPAGATYPMLAWQLNGH